MHGSLPAMVETGQRLRIAARVFVAGPDERPELLVTRILRRLGEARQTALLMVVYGRREALRGLDLPRDVPVMAVEGRPCHAGAMAGAFVYVCPDTTLVTRLRVDGRTTAVVIEEQDARCCLFTGSAEGDPLAPRAEQARHAFERLDVTLKRAGFAIRDVIRTWFYNEDILGWYADFNRVRTQFYRRQAFRTGSMPASTGVGGEYASGAALGLSGWAFQSFDAHGGAFEVASPLQCPAPNYGSSFSRAMELPAGGQRRLFISGTASIAASGESLWPGDLERQFERTIEVMTALLASRNMTWAQVDRAVAYFKKAADYPRWIRWQEQQGFAPIPCLAVEGTVCRDDLLFELEADAIATQAAVS